MPLTTSLCLAGASGLFNLWLAYRCVRIRLDGPGGVGDLENPALRSRMRAHSNFVEYTPFVLILVALIEHSGGRAPLLQELGIAYMTGRVLHALGIERPVFTMQFIGAMTTWLVLLVLVVWALVIALA